MTELGALGDDGVEGRLGGDGITFIIPEGNTSQYPAILHFDPIGYKNTSINVRFIHAAGGDHNNEGDGGTRKMQLIFRPAHCDSGGLRDSRYS